MKEYIPPFKTFIFESYHFEPSDRTIELHYSYEGKPEFTERVFFAFDFIKDYNQKALDKALFGLFIVCGVSYYKAYLAPEIIIKQGSLNKEQAEFFNQLYLHGLGEFLYKNKLDSNLMAQFPYSRDLSTQPVEVNGLRGNILPVGGGTDSLLAAEILKASGDEFTSWRVNSTSWIDSLLKEIGDPAVTLRRTISSNLLELNQKGALNGHVPISAILSFLSVCSAILSGKKNTIMANESSANSGNTTYRGLSINHQYSKSLKFEEAFQNYVKNYITPSINYFSLLRPLSQLRIVELFAQHRLGKYRDRFCSCNRNFISATSDRPSWCGTCPKCASTFALLSPFVERERLIALFSSNLFSDARLQTIWEELLGIKGVKPFECVGEVEEINLALQMASQSGQWPELNDFPLKDSDFDYQKLSAHAMPPSFYQILQQFLSRD